MWTFAKFNKNSLAFTIGMRFVSRTYVIIIMANFDSDSVQYFAINMLTTINYNKICLFMIIHTNIKTTIKKQLPLHAYMM